jgi:hypothetical protein
VIWNIHAKEKNFAYVSHGIMNHMMIVLSIWEASGLQGVNIVANS